MYCKAVFVLVCAAPQSERGVVTVSWTEVDAGEQQRAVAHFRQPYSTSFLRSRAAIIVFLLLHDNQELGSHIIQ